MIARQRLIALLFIMPACGLIGVFVFWPAGAMAHSSVHHHGLTAPHVGKYVGGDNYRALLSDPDFRQAAANTARFTLLVVPIQTALALLLATWTNGPGWSRRTLRLAVFVPTVVSLTVLSVLWKLLYAPAGAAGAGLFNGLLGALSLGHQPFLTSPSQAMVCIVAMSIWQGVGFQMMIFLSGLQAIPAQLYEAAELDGARRRERFWHITLPGLGPTTVLVVMVTTIFALKLFVQPYLMTGGGPAGSTLSVVQYIYRAAFSQRDLGLACAAGALFFVAVTTVTVLQRLATRKAEASS
ncbi:MAG: sugar ABC transporter permease [bacterium]|nr:sugar ABC transporter permease [bacterium]